MRFWCEVYTLSGVFEGIVYNLTSVSKIKLLDGAGSINLTYSGSNELATTLIQKERRVRVFVEDDGGTRFHSAGDIVEINVNASDKTAFTASGPDTLLALTRRTVGLGRSYTDESVYNIVTDLLDIVGGGWFATVDDGVGNQTSRFDGVSVLKALIRTAQELGLHLREGLDSNEVEIGAFGEDIGITALAPGSMTPELEDNDSIVLITDFKQKSSSRDVCNTVTPLGAGEGAAALTLRDSTRSTAGGYPYDIQVGTEPDGRTRYYLQDDDSIDLYGIIEKPPVVFKEIGPVANSSAAKILAANALYDAAAAWLQRNAVSLDSYSLNVRKVRKQIRPGDLIHIGMKDLVETATGSFTPVNIRTEDTFWVMKITETISEQGATAALEVNTVDRQEMDMVETIVGAVESISVKNISVQTFVQTFVYTYVREIAGTNVDAEFILDVPNTIIDLLYVAISFRSFPLMAPTYYYGALVPPELNWDVTQGYNYPSGLTLWINGTDVTSGVGGGTAWNSGSNVQTDEGPFDITTYIENASGGIYQAHAITMKAEQRSGEVRIDTGYPSRTNLTASTGKIEMTFVVVGTTQALHRSAYA